MLVPRFSYLGLRDAVLAGLFRVPESVITRDHQCPLSALTTARICNCRYELKGQASEKQSADG